MGWNRGFRFYFIFREQGRGVGEKHWGVRNTLISCLSHPLNLGIWPSAQARALTGNPTGNPLVHRLVLSPLSHTSQDYLDFLKVQRGLITINIFIPVFPRSVLRIKVLVHLPNRILSSAKHRGNNILILWKTNSLQYFQSKPNYVFRELERMRKVKRNHTCSFSFIHPNGKLMSVFQESLYTQRLMSMFPF